MVVGNSEPSTTRPKIFPSTITYTYCFNLHAQETVLKGQDTSCTLNHSRGQSEWSQDVPLHLARRTKRKWMGNSACIHKLHDMKWFQMNNLTISFSVPFWGGIFPAKMLRMAWSTAQPEWRWGSMNDIFATKPKASNPGRPLETWPEMFRPQRIAKGDTANRDTPKDWLGVRVSALGIYTSAYCLYPIWGRLLKKAAGSNRETAWPKQALRNRAAVHDMERSKTFKQPLRLIC